MSRNVVKDYINFDKECMHKYIDIVTNKKVHSRIVDEMLKTYVDVRYYNIYDPVNEYSIENIGYYIKENVNKLIQNKKVNDDEKKAINNALWIIKYVLFYEKINNDKSLQKMLLDLEEKIRSSFKASDKKKDDLFTSIRRNTSAKRKFIRGLSSNEFSVERQNTNLLNVYMLKFFNSVKIPELYSETAIRRVYNNGSIGEDKYLVFYTLSSVIVLSDLLGFNYDRTYIMDFNSVLLVKKNKLNSLFRIIDLDILKEKLIMKISIDEYITFKDQVDQLIRNGYSFAINMDESFKKIKDNVPFDVFTYIIFDGKIENIKDFPNIDKVIISELVGE